MTNTEKAKSIFARLGEHVSKKCTCKGASIIKGAHTEDCDLWDELKDSDDYRDQKDRDDEDRMNDHFERGLEEIAHR